MSLRKELERGSIVGIVVGVFSYSMNHWSDEEGETARGDQARVVMRQPMEKEATRSADVSVYMIRVALSMDTGCTERWWAHTISRTETVFSPPMATRSGASALSQARTTWMSAPWSCRRSIMIDLSAARLASPDPGWPVSYASRLASESKTCTESCPLPRSRPLFIRRILRSRPPPRSYRPRILTPPLERPSARLARSLA